MLAAIRKNCTAKDEAPERRWSLRVRGSRSAEAYPQNELDHHCWLALRADRQSDCARPHFELYTCRRRLISTSALDNATCASERRFSMYATDAAVAEPPSRASASTVKRFAADCVNRNAWVVSFRAKKRSSGFTYHQSSVEKYCRAEWAGSIRTLSNFSFRAVVGSAFVLFGDTGWIFFTYCGQPGLPDMTLWMGNKNSFSGFSFPASDTTVQIHDPE